MVTDIADGTLSDNFLIQDYVCNNFVTSDVNLTPSDIDAQTTFLSSTTLTSESLALFEMQSLSNSDLSNDLYKNIAYLKYTLLFRGDISIPNIGTFEKCLDGCIRDAMADIFLYGNVVDRIAYVAGMPASFAWTVASCGYDCAGGINGGGVGSGGEHTTGLSFTPCEQVETETSLIAE